MGTIKSIEIFGYKKFEHLYVEFNSKTNIIVGENESGKSTILEAISLVLNQWYRNADKSIIKELLNANNVNNFYAAPSIEMLPEIYIEIQFDLSVEEPNARAFWGAVKRDIQTEAFGISFECRFDVDEFGELLADEISAGKIPFEYYKMSWKTFQGNSYNLLKRPLNSVFIDTSATEAWSSFNYFNKSLFNSKYSEPVKSKARNDFRQKVGEIIDTLGFEALEDNQRFGISSKKLILENLISVFDNNNIPLESKGKGIESLIKTQISLDKASSKVCTALIEEPENHLSFSTLLKMITEIENRASVCQIILTTHNNLIASRLNLKNILWLSQNRMITLTDVDDRIAEYFIKADNNNFLNMLLSKKVILVEGATEYILLPKLYSQYCKSTIEQDEVTIISCNGLSYKNYLHIAEKAGKKVAVITDNDKKQENIDYMNSFNADHVLQHIFMASDVEEWTWEVCLYKINTQMFNSIIDIQDGAEYRYNGVSYGKHLGKMLNNKVETAYQLLVSEESYEIPRYVKEAMQWIRE